jgi:hypothetical protein
MNNILVNKGVSVVGSADLPQSPAIVVVGAARGGTSMIAGALAKLGVYTGDKSSPPVYEDVRLSTCFEARDFQEVQRVRDEYNQKYNAWVWKRPSSIDYLNDVHQLLNAPRYIFVYKDVMSIAQRNTISMLSELLPGMERPLKQYIETLKFLRSTAVFAMLVSYEKAMAHPDYFLNELAMFCKLEPSNEQLESARSFIDPNPEAYLDSSRITKAEGCLDGLINRKIFGWARLIHAKKIAEVEFFLNDKKIGCVISNQSRSDLDSKFGLSCAYDFEIPESITLIHGDKLRARVVNEVRDLNNSPLEFKI